MNLTAGTRHARRLEQELVAGEAATVRPARPRGALMRLADLLPLRPLARAHGTGAPGALLITFLNRPWLPLIIKARLLRPAPKQPGPSHSRKRLSGTELR